MEPTNTDQRTDITVERTLVMAMTALRNAIRDNGIDLASDAFADLKRDLDALQVRMADQMTTLAEARAALARCEANLNRANEAGADDATKERLQAAVDLAIDEVDVASTAVADMTKTVDELVPELPEIKARLLAVQAAHDAEEQKAAADADDLLRRRGRIGTRMADEIKRTMGEAAANLSDDLIAVLEDNLNGSPLASDAEVAAGYISAEHYFHYFSDTVDTIPRANGSDGTRVWAAGNGETLPVSFLRNLALNCHMIRKGKKLTISQFLTCFIKTLIAYSGNFQPNTNARCVFIDEYMSHDVVPEGFTATVREMAVMKKQDATREAEESIKRNLHRIIGTAVHVFRTRNHHWTDSSQEFVSRTWSAAWNGEPPSWPMSDEELFRSSLHCFGMKPLVDYCVRADRQQLLPVALKIRQTAARAGTAPVRLVAATLACMRAEPFYTEVRAAFADQIVAVNAHVEDLKVAGDKAHVNHWFMCGARARADYREALAEPLMPIAVAYIQSLGPLATLKSQQALKKRVANHASLVDSLKDKFIAYRKEIFDNSNLVQILQAYRSSVLADAAPTGPAVAPAAPTGGAGAEETKTA